MVIGLIPGKLLSEDVGQLLELVDGKKVLMLGCYCGRALVEVALRAERTWVLEDFRYPGGSEAVMRELGSNVDRNVPEERPVHLLRGDAEGWAVPFGSEDLPQDGVDVIYRDANRRPQIEDLDQRLAMGLLRRRGGLYLWHDEEYRLKWLEVQPVPVEVN